MHRYLFKLVIEIISTPFSLLWEYIYRLRRFLYNYGFFKQNHFSIPIISIGNLSFGGTGKTPMTLWLSNYLNSLNMKVMVLTRGYQSDREKSFGILKSKKKIGMNPFEFGDEPLLLARRIEHGSVVLGRNRSENLSYYFNEEQPDVVVLDDGHQHLQLHRDLNILLFDSTMPRHRYYTAPKGYLREGLTAIRDADAIVFSKRDRVASADIEDLKRLISSYVSVGTIFAEVGNFPTGVYNANRSIEMKIPELSGLKVICVAAIASPAPFFDLARSLGLIVAETYVYADHHFYTTEEVNGWLKKAHEIGAFILVTEKDIVKIRRCVDDDRIRYLEIDQKFFKGQVELEALVRKRANVRESQ